MAHDAHCPECDWKVPAQSSSPDRLVAIVKDLEVHLAGDHDWTWYRAHEHADAWYRRLVKLPELDKQDGPAPSRTARCEQCDWSTRARSEELLEIGRCASELDKHLKAEHALKPEDSQRVAESWALALLRNRVR